MRFYISKRLGWGIRIGAISDPVHPFRKFNALESQPSDNSSPYSPQGLFIVYIAGCMFLGLLLAVYVMSRVDVHGNWHWF